MSEKPQPQKVSGGVKKGSKKGRGMLFLVVLLAFSAAGGWYWYINLYGFISVDDAYIDRDKATISAKVLGRIVKIAVDEGNPVQKDQTLVELDPAELLAQQKQAEAALVSAQANVNLAKVNLDKMQGDFSRAAAQAKNQIISEETYAHAKNALEAAQASYKMAQDQVEVSKAQIEVIKTNLKNTVIIAPFNGIVAKKWAMEGDVVQPAQPILSINDTEAVWVAANFEETNLVHLGLNEDVRFTVDAFPKREFSGKIMQIGSSTAAQFSLIPPNNAAGNFTKITQRIPVKISVAPANDFELNKLLPGMSVVVKIKRKDQPLWLKKNL